MGVGGSSTFLQIGGNEPFLRVITDLFASYVGSGPDLPGGEGEGELTSIIEFVMPVEHAEWSFSFTQNIDPGFTQSSLLTVENVTANTTLVSTTVPFGFIDELNANVGDVIRVTSAYSASGIAQPGATGLFNSGATLAMDLIIPEPTTMGLLVFGGILCLLARKSRKAHWM